MQFSLKINFRLLLALIVKTTITVILESLLIKPKHVQIAQKRN